MCACVVAGHIIWVPLFYECNPCSGAPRVHQVQIPEKRPRSCPPSIRAVGGRAGARALAGASAIISASGPTPGCEPGGVASASSIASSIAKMATSSGGPCGATAIASSIISGGSDLTSDRHVTPMHAKLKLRRALRYSVLAHLSWVLGSAVCIRMVWERLGVRGMRSADGGVTRK